MDEKMKSEFISMLKEARGTPQEWSVIMAMVDMLQGNKEFEDMAELYKGVAEYGEFLTEKEAKHIVDEFENYDGSHGPKWPIPSVVFDTIEGLGGKRAESGMYNCWAMFVLMNMIHSDYGGVISTLAQGENYAKACYMMAVAWVKDNDKPMNIRKYFGLE